jgi:hypothetical protein
MTIRANISLGFSIAEVAGSARFGGASNWQGAFDFAKSFADGVGVDQCDLGYLNERTVASNSNDDVDLSGVLTSALASNIAIAELVAIFVMNRPRLATDPANTTNLTIGGGSNPFLGFLGGTTPVLGPIKPGGFFLLGCGGADGIGAVVNSSADILRIANSTGASATYVLGLLGRSS